jgi:hypothetical protein
LPKGEDKPHKLHHALHACSLADAPSGAALAQTQNACGEKRSFGGAWSFPFTAEGPPRHAKSQENIDWVANGLLCRRLENEMPD